MRPRARGESPRAFLPAPGAPWFRLTPDLCARDRVRVPESVVCRLGSLAASPVLPGDRPARRGHLGAKRRVASDTTHVAGTTHLSRARLAPPSRPGLPISPRLTTPARGRAWSAAARWEALVATAALDEHATSAWCRQHGLYPTQLDVWRQGALDALADPQEARATPQATQADKRRIQELERDLLRKDRALAETTALLVLAKKLSAILPGHADA